MAKDSWDEVVKFAEKAIKAGKYVGGTRAAVKVLIKDVTGWLQPDEPKDVAYLFENVREILNRNNRGWSGPSFNVYFAVLRRLLKDFGDTKGDVYKLKPPQNRNNRKRNAITSETQPIDQEVGNGRESEVETKGRRISFDLPEGPVTLLLPSGITSEGWNHIKDLVGIHIKYLADAGRKSEVD